MSVINILFLSQYFLLNGFLIHHYFISRGKETDILERSISAILISTTLNSLVLYFLAEGLSMPITRINVLIMSLSLTILILATANIHRLRT